MTLSQLDQIESNSFDKANSFGLDTLIFLIFSPKDCFGILQFDYLIQYYGSEPWKPQFNSFFRDGFCFKKFRAKMYPVESSWFV